MTQRPRCRASLSASARAASSETLAPGALSQSSDVVPARGCDGRLDLADAALYEAGSSDDPKRKRFGDHG